MVLFERYLPLVRSFYTKRYITGMEFDDWKQEAIVVMIKVIGIFDSRRARFGRLYKTALRNKICDLLRRQKALRRVPPN